MKRDRYSRFLSDKIEKGEGEGRGRGRERRRRREGM